MPTQIIRDLLSDAVARLAPHESARLDAELLLGHVLGKSRSFLFAYPEHRLDAEASARFQELIEARSAGHPIAQLIGKRNFWTLELAVDEHTLIPRPETELLVEAALARIPSTSPWRIADLGTGSGAIALAIASVRRLAQLVATDRSAAALRVASGNAERLGLHSRIEFKAGDWCAPLQGQQFDLVVSNPPYIRADDAHLQQGDLRFEPIDALASGADGLDAIRVIATTAPAHLQPGGWLLLEHGFDQGAAVRALLDAAGFFQIETLLDLEARERVTLGRMPGQSPA
jgi:release factor glutamine methyltransferase